LLACFLPSFLPSLLQNQSQSRFATDGQSVSQSVSQSILELRPFGTHDQILVLDKTIVFLSWGFPSVERTGLSCNSLQSLSVSSDIYICRF
jgi:hypothetical protein